MVARACAYEGNSLSFHFIKKINCAYSILFIEERQYLPVYWPRIPLYGAFYMEKNQQFDA